MSTTSKSTLVAADTLPRSMLALNPSLFQRLALTFTPHWDFKNENEKIAIYRDILSKIPGDMNIVLKTHPREHTRYEEHFKNITVLPGLFPIEILCLKEGFHFNHGYTLFSTALTNLDIVNKRFFLGKDYLDKFTTKATRNLVKNMVVDL